ncbi:MAG TPA: acyltransferase [Polyangiaceae bacterium]|jgi:peptidoglycan/LPS O-acetylase OafA/YrhL|nr:acyltransferase [Polyangiaceae bacterium]
MELAEARLIETHPVASSARVEKGARSSYVPAVDWLKGVAIILVVCVHAKVYETSLFHLHVVNRAVPIFLVLLGVTSETFWERHAGDSTRERLRLWYRRRFTRLAPAVWAMAAVWWGAVLLLHQTEQLGLGWREAVLCFLGYSPWMGTAWFVTLILQLVLVLPALRWVAVRLGPFVMLPLTAAICAYTTFHVWDLVELGRAYVSTNLPQPGFFYNWIFVPRVLWQVTAGIFVARYLRARPGVTATVVAAAIWAVGTRILVELPLSGSEAFIGPVRHQAIENLLDVPLSIALLGLFCSIERWQRNVFLRFLAFVGRASWGIYVGHALVYELLHLVGIGIETGPESWRNTYALFLFVVGVTLAVIGGWLRRLVTRAARGPAPAEA